MKLKILKIVLVIAGSATVLYFIANSHFGWYAYKKWLNRTTTSGNKIESIQRGAFVKSVDFHFEPRDLSFPFEAFIERGFKYGKHSMDDTNFNLTSNFPYQLSITRADTASHRFFSLDSSNCPDSCDQYSIFLSSASIPDTIRVFAISNSYDTLGIIIIPPQ